MSRKMDWDRVGREGRAKRHGSASVYSKNVGPGKKRNRIGRRRNRIQSRRFQRLRRGIVRITNELGEVTFDKLYDRCRAWKIEEGGVSVQRLLKELKLLDVRGKLRLDGRGTKVVVRTASGRPDREGEGE